MIFISIFLFLIVSTCELLDVLSTVCPQVVLQLTSGARRPRGLTLRSDWTGSAIVSVFCCSRICAIVYFSAQC